METLERVHIDCSCGSPEHSLRFSLCPDEDPEMSFLSIEVHLNSLVPWYKKIWYAITYLCGKKSRYGWGCFDEATLEIDQVVQLRNLCNKFIDQHHGVGKICFR